MNRDTLIAVMIAMLVGAGISCSASAQLDTGYLSETFLNQDPDPAEPGKYVDLRWKVEKLGNEQIDNIQYYLEVEYPFFIDEIDTPERNLGNWEGFSQGDEFHTLIYRVRVDEDALEGTYDVTLRTRTDNSDIWIMQDYGIRVGEKVRPEFILGQLSTSPVKLTSDTDEAEINVEIANIGDGGAENVVVQIELPAGFAPSQSYSDRDTLGSVPAGMGKVATFYVDINRDVIGGMHDAMLKISYKESGSHETGLKSKEIMLGLPLKDKPLFEIEKVSTVPETIQPGDTVEMRLDIKNVGGEEADAVSVRVFKDSSQQLDLIEKSDFVGKLKPGETGEAVLKIGIDSDAVLKKYTLDIEIRAIDGSEVIIQDRSITMQVGGNQTAGGGVTGAAIGELSPMMMAVFVVVLIVVGSGSYMLGKRNTPKAKK